MQFRDFEDIKAEIRRRGYTVQRLSQELGFSATALSIRWKRPRAWPLLDERLADFLGTTPQRLFPEHYTASGHPKGIVRRSKAIRPFNERLCPNLAKGLAA